MSSINSAICKPFSRLTGYRAKQSYFCILTLQSLHARKSRLSFPLKYDCGIFFTSKKHFQRPEYSKNRNTYDEIQLIPLSSCPVCTTRVKD